MARRMRGNVHVRCRAGENLEITSKGYLLLFTISMANEYGKAAVMVLYGCEILNQGSQFSMDNIISQQACTFVARRLKCLEAVDLTN